MITELHIKNFKSIVDETISLSNVNVFIGENGCGKTNILEAVGFASAASRQDLSTQSLDSKGIRSAKPSLILNSFLGKKQKEEISIEIGDSNGASLEYSIQSPNASHFFPDWKVKYGNLQGYIDNLKSVLKIEATNEGIGSKETINQLLFQANLDALLASKEYGSNIRDYLIYTPNTLSLRGLNPQNKIEPVGIYGENLDVLISSFSPEELKTLFEYSKLIGWLDKIIFDESDSFKFAGYKLGRSTSRLYFQDKFMSRKNNIFSAENANEGVLHILFYLALFISQGTPKFFAIDNIETALNPNLCRALIEVVAELAIKNEKQVLITTHHPAILDGLNLHDDRQRLFVVSRNDEGHTKVKRLKVKPDAPEKGLKFSEMWMRGYIGGIPKHI